MQNALAPAIVYITNDVTIPINSMTPQITTVEMQKLHYEWMGPKSV